MAQKLRLKTIFILANLARTDPVKVHSGRHIDLRSIFPRLCTLSNGISVVLLKSKMYLPRLWSPYLYCGGKLNRVKLIR